MADLLKVRSLNDCYNAQYPKDTDYIFCSKGHKLGNGHIHKRQVDRNAKLVCKICQLCQDFTPFDIPYIKEVTK